LWLSFLSDLRKDAMSDKTAKNPPMAALAVLLAWLVPGLGHVYMGRVARGIVIMVAVSATFWAGMGLGGAMTVDPQNERWWFIADMFTGVQGVGAWQYEQRTLNDVIAKNDLPADAAINPRYIYNLDQVLQQKGIALVTPVETIARAYSGVAGLLNLLCIFDVLMLCLMGEHTEPPPLGKDGISVAAPGGTS
jgi:TM2 domain-containing membrane protein YozV